MIELSQVRGDLLRKAFAGDTFNTAWYMRACLPKGWAVDYFTAVGEDRFSDDLLSMIDRAGIGSRNIFRIPGKTLGLYLINLSAGERSFVYWRSTSAARSLADNRSKLQTAIDNSNVVFFSGITLGILSDIGRNNFFDEIGRAKAAGLTVVFDPNIRPILWESNAIMLRNIERGARLSTIVLPSFDDEKKYFGDPTIQHTIDRYRQWGVQNILVKDGANGATVAFCDDEIAHVPAEMSVVVDTTSAGDSFNGGFLSHYLNSSNPREAAKFGAAVASIVIGNYGALVDPLLLPKLAT